MDADRFREIYSDEVKTTEILIETSGDYYINGEQLSDEYLNSDISKSLGASFPSISPSSYNETGGLSWLTYYTNVVQSSSDLFQCEAYSDANFFLDPQQGARLVKWLFTGSNLSDFKMYANQVGSARSNINSGMVVLAASGVTVLTPAAVLGLIGSSASAYTIYVASGDGHASMTNAYNLLNRLGGTIIH